MSALKEKIYSDLITAMKARDTLKTEALKMIKADIMKHEVSAADAQTTDEVVINILQKAVKQRKDAAQGFVQGGRDDMALKEEKEAEIYQAYLPEQMSEEEVKKIVKETIAEVGASGPGDIGKVMAAMMPKVKGKADGGLVNKSVKEALS